MERWIAGSGAVLALTAVALGAFAAHALEGRVEAAGLRTFETGVRYQMYHALALLWLSWAVGRWPATGPAGWLFLAGVVLFSGSLYVLSLSGVRWVGMITPLGGLSLLGGWAVVVIGIWRG